MQPARLQQDSPYGAGLAPIAGDFSQAVVNEPHGDRVQRDGLKTSDGHTVPKHSRRVGFGLPCANCKAYYAADLPICPICKCSERVPARVAGHANSAKAFKKPCGSVLQRVLRSFTNPILSPVWRQSRELAVHSDNDGNQFLLELLFCTARDEISGAAGSACILDENHSSQDESASVCLHCHEQVRQKLSRTEAALLIDLREAAQLIYEAVWTDPSPLEPSKTYENAAQALLSELRRRASMAGMPGPI